MTSSNLLPIGEVASSSGLSVSAIRYYEDVGLISAAERVGGKRRFDLRTIGRVLFIKRAQAAGFSLDEVQAILDDTAGGWSRLVDEKLAVLIRRRHELDQTIAALREVRKCGCEAVALCDAEPSILSTGS